MDINKFGKIHGGVSEKDKYAAENSLKVHPVLQKLIDETLKHEWKVMMGSIDELQLLQNLAFSIGAKKTLDIGVFTGVSSLALSLVLPEDGHVIACDVNEVFVNVGRPFWKEAGVENKIKFFKAPAQQTLQYLLDNGEEGTFDFAFIDADKENYDIYYEMSLRLLRKRGIIAIDNTLWSGKVMDENIKDKETESIRKLTKKVHNDSRVLMSFLTMADGVVLAFKK